MANVFAQPCRTPQCEAQRTIPTLALKSRRPPLPDKGFPSLAKKFVRNPSYATIFTGGLIRTPSTNSSKIRWSSAEAEPASG